MVRPRPRRSASAPAALLLAALATVPASRAQDVPHGFRVEPVLVGPFVTHPVGCALLPDERVLAIEKNTGHVHLAVPGDSTSTIVGTIPDVAPSFEGGLLGIAVDPEWPLRPFLYFHLNHSPNAIWVVRYRAAGALSDPASRDLQLLDPYVLLDDLPDQQGIHQGGTVRFGPDDCLYVSLGDDGAACDAQDRMRLAGKILRLDVSGLPDSSGGPPPKQSLAPAGNPWHGADPNESLVWAYGFRNPFRFTIDPRTGDLFAGDVGENAWEEVDQIVASHYAGENFGWPEYEARAQDPLPAAANCSTGPFTLPIFEYAHPPGGLASVVCGPLYRPAAGGARNFPDAYDGDLFVAEFYAGWIKRFTWDGVRWAIAPFVPGQDDPQSWATGMGNLCDLQVGPDGALYVVNLISQPGLAHGVYRIASTVATDAGGRTPESWVRVVPNPARVQSGVRLALGDGVAAEPGTVRVLDVAGRLVRALPLPAHASQIAWDGRDAFGRPVGAGVYVVRVDRGAGRRVTGRVVLD